MYFVLTGKYESWRLPLGVILVVPMSLLAAVTGMAIVRLPVDLSPDFCPVFEEMKSILAKTAGAPDILRAALAPLVDRISVALIYGSVARGQQCAESDVDLLVIGDAAFGEIVATLAEAQTQLRREVNPTAYPPHEFSDKIHAGHHFVKSILKREKIFLIGDDRELDRLAEKCVAGRT